MSKEFSYIVIKISGFFPYFLIWAIIAEFSRSTDFHRCSKLQNVYCTIKIPTIAEGNPKSCMRIFPIIADAFGISLRPQ